MDAKMLETLKLAHVKAEAELKAAQAKADEANEALKAAQRARGAALKPVAGLATAERFAYDAYVKAALEMANIKAK